MAVATAWLIKRAVYTKTKADTALTFYLLATMATMFGGALLYLLSPNLTSVLVAVGLNGIVMTGGVIFILRYYVESSFNENLKRLEASTSQSGSISSDTTALKLESKKAWAYRAGVISLVLLNEFLMGWAFILFSKTPAIASGSPSTVALSTFDTVVSSDWFVFTMVLEMFLTVYVLRKDLPRSFFGLVFLQSVVMFFAPTALDNSSWASSSIWLGSAAMIGLMIILYEYLFTNRSITSPIKGYFIELLIVYALMMLGLFVWVMNGNTLVFAVSIIGEMVIYFNIILAKSLTKVGIAGSKTKPWMSDPWWVFAFMGMTFVAEYFMGALLDVQYFGTNFIAGIPQVAVAGSLANQAGAAIYDFIYYFGSITGSSWFLIMMGVEMGALVVFKIMITRELETRIRLGLVILAYFVYSIYLPSFFLSNPANVPFVGWSMGVGTAGAIAPAVLGAILLTYLISGGLSFLFGARQTCSVFCTAALMYQGTFPDSLKEFNRTSKLGSKLLTSRMSNIYKTVSGIVIASILISTVLSYLNSIGMISFTIFGSDVASFLYIIYFNILWYIIFISIPFLGVYGCVSTGMCHWGLFNQFVSRFGLFKLKVKDPQVCASCETKDCAKACPVGLTDLPGNFIKSGQFKSHKCIGVGDCVSACPYENEYFYDIRNVFGKKFGSGKNDARRLPSLPVVGTPGEATIMKFSRRKGSDSVATPSA